ncbi:MAG: lysophospholipid acyltransferase family protein [Candidatus Marinimicrobia bacterium]|nr:lysophospholipid acyltransferase family protein [Candidatus Neomarinimicrobiota bacterium]MCF7828588.1 lysophospholipid acyltransferase family protein [Candidatus Neomarinimicrobiota bacterium]MCF7880329.1 lysophospholipid acyltransferase family protein [Candidatus Neomarinimicrobiota bacterium]
MIKAEKTWWADQLFRRYVFRSLRKHFAGISLVGEVPVIDPKLPVILAPNHSTWWDGFFVYALNEKLLNRDLYLMMTEEQLSRFPFFRKVGAYSINLKSTRDALNSLRYTTELLARDEVPGPMACIFPQGKLEPWHRRPLEYKPGLQWIINHCVGAVSLLPLAIYVTFIDQQYPEVFILFGETCEVSSSSFQGVDWLAGEEESLLDRLLQTVDAGERKQVLFQGRRSADQRWSGIKHLWKGDMS